MKIPTSNDLKLIGIEEAAAGAAIGLIGQLAGGAASQGFTKRARAENYAYNERSADNAQKRLYKQYYDLQSPEARRKQIEDAGLSVGLMYGQNGAPGSTQVAQGNGPSGPVPTAPTFDLMTSVMQAQQIENIKADTEKKEAEKNKTENDTIPPQFKEFAEIRDAQKQSNMQFEESETNRIFTDLQNRLKDMGAYSLANSLSISESKGENGSTTYSLSYSEGNTTSKSDSSSWSKGESSSKNSSFGGGSNGFNGGNGKSSSTSKSEGESHSEGSGHNESHGSSYGESWGKTVAKSHAESHGQSGNKLWEERGKVIDDALERMNNLHTHCVEEDARIEKAYKEKCEGYERKHKK